MDILWGFFGIAVVFGIAFIFSSNRKAISKRTVFGGLAIQIMLGFIILKFEPGKVFLETLTNIVNSIISSADDGIKFLFGGLIGKEDIGFIFAFQVLPIIIFVSAIVSILYYAGIMQVIIKIIGGALSKLLGTSKTESLSAAANIFLGQTEAPLVVKPYLAKMTRSELFAIMTGGLASVSGSVLIGYTLLGVPLEYLLVASFLAAPAGLIIAKIMMPETEKSAVSDDIEIVKDTESANVIDAAARGASVGMQLALNIGAMLLAFIALIALFNGFLGWIGGIFNFQNLTLEGILGYVFSPIAFAIGVPWEEAVQAGGYIGQKLVLNEFVAYSFFGPEIDTLSPKTGIIISFALCGFANISSIGILLGGLGGLAPNRRGEIAKLGFKAVLAGMLASLLSASIAGMLF
ncbi:NupC/NupG family nucleoside CNT transporter [Chengkuizengella marina]|uniref:Nucleoside permease n=1 Tax=Chengkuizengella marina TaxID=2507566 RepID=A0A6N9Q158_9BACL|nr:NupC/NupG family nucleoside CNT transporter [Chengkuizengella marina]NBI28513.1 NupC/NupG family nucleoside CNT transporter [Chengkuizengella marina]